MDSTILKGLGGYALLSIPVMMGAGLTWNDWKTDGQWLPALEMRTTSASCHSFPLVFSWCTISLKAPEKSQKLDVDLQYFVMGLSWGGEKFIPMRSTVDGHLSTSVGLEHMTQRLLSLVIWLAGFLSLGLAIFVHRASKSASDRAGEPAEDLKAPVRAQARAGFGQGARLNGVPLGARAQAQGFGRRR